METYGTAAYLVRVYRDGAIKWKAHPNEGWRMASPNRQMLWNCDRSRVVFALGGHGYSLKTIDLNLDFYVDEYDWNLYLSLRKDSAVQG